LHAISSTRVTLAVAVLGVVAAAAWRALARPSRVELAALADLSLAAAPPAELAEGPSCAVQEVARVGRRVTALLLASDGVLHVGTSGAGVVRVDPAGGGDPVAPALAGRERFVNALAEYDDLVWVATQRGVVALDGERRVLSLLREEEVTALARAGTSLYAGTARGVFRISAEDGALPVDASGPSGEPLRVTALAASGGRLWIGTSSGAYSLPLAEVEAPLLARTARRHPLASGEPSSEANVVTALAPLAGGVVVGTDDGGVARIREDGGVTAGRFAERAANEVSPGAAAALAGAGGAGVLLGTGGGLLVARAHGEGLRVSRVARGEVSAVQVSDGGEGLLAGGADGVVLSGSCPAPLGRQRQATQTEPFVAQLDCGYLSRRARPVAGSASLSPPL
jgi:ligand-binding sensor domain-containing protein